MFVQFRNAFLNYISESESRSDVSDPLWPHGLYSPWNSPGQNTGVGSLSLLQGVFPTQESNLGLLYCKHILYKLSYKGSPNTVKVKVAQLCPTLCDLTNYTVLGILQARILEWVAIPFAKGSSQPRYWTKVSCIAGGFFINWAIREALLLK